MFASACGLLCFPYETRAVLYDALTGALGGSRHSMRSPGPCMVFGILTTQAKGGVTVAPVVLRTNVVSDALIQTGPCHHPQFSSDPGPMLASLPRGCKSSEYVNRGTESVALLTRG